MGNPNCCFMIIAGTFFSPGNRRGELCTIFPKKEVILVGKHIKIQNRYFKTSISLLLLQTDGDIKTCIFSCA